jgi:1-acyl-sn-glycerol-3-phosphate acyltransferase
VLLAAAVPRYRVVIGWCWLILQGARWICGIRWRVVGVENVPAGPCIVMSKHSSTWETLFLTQSSRRSPTSPRRSSCRSRSSAGHSVSPSPITIDRKAGADALTQIAHAGRERLAQGFWIVLYPEGTRHPCRHPRALQDGRLQARVDARRAAAAVAHNAGWLWPKGVLGKRPGTITVSIGKPLPARPVRPARRCRSASRPFNRGRRRAHGRARQ